MATVSAARAAGETVRHSPGVSRGVGTCRYKASRDAVAPWDDNRPPVRLAAAGMVRPAWLASVTHAWDTVIAGKGFKLTGAGCPKVPSNSRGILVAGARFRRLPAFAIAHQVRSYQLRTVS